MRKVSLQSVVVPAIVGILLIASAVVASPPSVPRLINFQARVHDAGGNPVPDGLYGVTFSLYTHSSGGVFLWSENAPAKSVVGGVFTHALGSIVPIAFSVEDYDSLWVEVVFDGEMQTPRIHLMSSPSAQIANALEARSVSTPSVNAVETRWDLGGISQNGSDGGEQVRLWGPSWGEILVNDNAVDGLSDEVLISSVSGGLLRLRKPDGSNGATLAGGGVGLGGSLVLTDDIGLPTVTINADQNGDVAVQVPGSSISAIECLNEPGVANDNASGLVALVAGDVQVVLSRTISVPSNGYVLAIGTAQLEIARTGNPADSVVFGVSNDMNAFPPTGGLLISVEPGAAGGENVFPVTDHLLFPVTAGANSFYLLAQELRGTASVEARHLTLIFIPTSYGTVESPVPGDGNGLDGVFDPSKEPQEAAELNAQRIERELAIVRAQAEETSRRLAELEARLPKQQPHSAVAKPEN